MTTETDALSAGNYPAPPVPGYLNLRDFPFMQLDVRKLRESRFASAVSPEAFRAGVLLWCASWHQVPAGSLPDDDIELSSLAGFGRVLAAWREVKAEALYGFVKCSDGRLYHRTLCEAAVDAFEKRLGHFYERACDRLRKANKARMSQGLAPIPFLTFEQWNEKRIADDIPPAKAEASVGTRTDFRRKVSNIPPENALKGEGEGEREGKGDTPAPRGGAGGGPAAPPVPPAPPSPPPPPAPAPPAPARKTTARKKGEPLPRATGPEDRARRAPSVEDWPIPKDLREWATENVPGLDLQRETAAFRDCEFRDPHSDWPATWRNWMRREWKRLPPSARARTNPPRPPLTAEHVRGVADDAAAVLGFTTPSAPGRPDLPEALGLPFEETTR